MTMPLLLVAVCINLLANIQEKQVGEIVLKAMGQAISKTVAIAEIIKVGSAYL